MSAALIADKLRASLLQAAIQGKLTKQLAEDGDARDLLKAIEAEKARLIEEKIIKKEKPLPPITDEEIPFEIPENWVWVRLGDVTYNRGQKTPNDKFTYVDIASIDNKNQKLGCELEIIEAKNAPSRARKIVQKGDLIYATVRPYLLNTCIIDRDISPEPIVSTGFAVLVTPFTVMNNYLLYLLISPFFNSYANDNENAKGVAYPAINDAKLKLGLFPLPPLAEQHRIVEAIETALAKIDKLKTDETKLYDIQKAFPNKLRASLLQSAIQGQLTEQLPEDGNARDLLKAIEAEKARLIEEKIIKKEKPLPPITDEEIPFEIPENWAWVYLKSLILETDAGKSPKCEGRNVSLDQWGVLTTTAIQKNLFLEEENKILPSSFVVNEAMQVKNHDLLITRAGPTNRTGVACVVNNLKYKLILSDKTVRIKYMQDMVSPNYIALFINSDFGIEQVKELATGMDKQQVNLSQDKIKSFKIPLPPLAEQERIVKKLDEILGKVDGLKKIAG